MTIDEAIKELTESYNFWMEFACDDVLEEGGHKVNHCEKNANYCYQLIQWLEELKTYKEYGVINKESFDKGYDKALDDVLAKIKEPTEVKISHWQEHDVIDSRQREIIKKIKKLKDGGENE